MRFVPIDIIKCSLLITDPGHWVENEDEIFKWCRNNEVKMVQIGMMVEFQSEQDRTMFILRWE